MMLGWRMALAARASLKKRVQELRVVIELGLEHLDGDLAADAGVLGQIDRTHAPFAEEGYCLVIAVPFADHAARATNAFWSGTSVYLPACGAELVALRQGLAAALVLDHGGFVLGDGGRELVGAVVLGHEVEVVACRRVGNTAASAARPGLAMGPGGRPS